MRLQLNVLSRASPTGIGTHPRSYTLSGLIGCSLLDQVVTDRCTDLPWSQLVWNVGDKGTPDWVLWLWGSPSRSLSLSFLTVVSFTGVRGMGSAKNGTNAYCMHFLGCGIVGQEVGV